MTDTLSLPKIPELPGMTISKGTTATPFPVPTKTTPRKGKNIPVPIPTMPNRPHSPYSPTISVIPQPKKEIISESKTEIILETSCKIISQESNSYEDIISHNMESELTNLGYRILNKIIVSDINGNKKVLYLKAINLKGQKVFIYVDVPGFTSMHQHDLVLIENNNGNIIPYSTKNGACDCAGTDVSGIAFEYGTNSVCTLLRENNYLKLNESNYTFINIIDNNSRQEGCIISYPIIRLSEIRISPEILLNNTDIVIRRLRNAEDSYERGELTSTHNSLENLNITWQNFNCVFNDITMKLATSLKQCDDYNNIYLANPPCDDEYKEKFHKLQYALAKRHEGIIMLTCAMKKVANKRREIDCLNKDVDEIIKYLEKEFAGIEQII